ncbi:MAG: ATP-binding protein [Sneathiellaceae bacterium]
MTLQDETAVRDTPSRSAAGEPAGTALPGAARPPEQARTARLAPLLPLALLLALPVGLVFAGLALAGFLAADVALAAGLVLVVLVFLCLGRHMIGLLRLTWALRDEAGMLAADRPGVDESARLPRSPATGLSRLIAAIDSLRQAQAGRRQGLARALQSAERILDALPDPLLILDGERRVLRANHRASEMFGPLAGHDLAFSIRHPQVLDMVDTVLAQDLDRAETEFVLADSERTIRAQCVRYGRGGTVPARGGTAVAMLLLHDLTAVKRVEQMRADFVANASHELKTPLASLIGFIETLQGPARDDRDAHERFLAIMAEQADRMSRLVRDLLSLSQIELNEHSPPDGRVDLADLARHVAHALQPPAAAREVTLTATAAPGLPAVVGDRDQIEQILLNLVDNAIKYGHEGGRVDLVVQRAGPVGSSQVPARLRDGVMIAVSDQGEGIPREFLSRLTERFYRVDQARSRALGGTGLGLAIVKHIVNRHRGILSIHSILGIGTTFTVVLPAASIPDGDGGTAATDNDAGA